MAELVILKDGKEVSRRRLATAALSIGRDAGNDLVLSDPAVSRVHAKILPRGGDFVLEDRYSSRGSFVGGKKIIEHSLQDGDEIRIGEHRLYFFRQEGSSPPARPSSAAPSDPGGAWAQVGTMLLEPARAQEGVARLKALLDISRLLETTRDFHSVLTELMDKAIAVMGAERGILMLKDATSGDLRLKVARQGGGDIAAGEWESFSRSVVREVTEKGRPLLLQDAGSQEWGTQSIIAHNIRSVLCVPLKTQETVTGVIAVDHRSKTKAFSELDLAFFTTFALQAKAAIDSSRSYWELVESLFNASADIVVMTDAEGRITRANRAAAVLLGPGGPALEGREIAGFFAETDRTAVTGLCGTLLAQGSVSGLEARLAGPGSSEVALSLSGFSMRDRQGGVVGLCLIGRDMTELRRLLTKLAELNDMKSQYVGMVSHELKGPMSILRGYIDIILEDKDPAPAAKHQEFLRVMLRRINHVTTLISDLLDLTRIETGKVALALAPVDPKALLEDVVGDYRKQAAESGVTLQVDAERAPASIAADEGMIRRVVANFTSNGIKYNKKGGTLWITAAAREGNCVLSFRDEGLGISPEDRKKLFGRFFRSDAVRDIPGTGLGLSIVAAIVERHGGRIEVESEVGRGATFRVTLPLERREG